MYILLLVLCVIAIFLFRWYTYHKYWKYVNKIPGPKALPIIGNNDLVNVDNEEIFRIFRERSKLFYPIYKIWSFEIYVIFLAGPPKDMEVSKNINLK
uniref:Cytochrome P450 4C1-like n=1 Tax=Diabrotica virgifera virgifera TaxID=50390 RepID=A0A6P7FDP3_DIAVI